MDKLARESTAHAHRMITELRREMRRVEKRMARRTHFSGRCYLCGAPARRRYCHGCSWAEGIE
jgi:hypothetical protein